jgi:hypothetical protein
MNKFVFCVLILAMGSISQAASRAAFCKVEGVSSKLNMAMMDDRIITLYSDSNDTETSEFNPSKVTVLRYRNSTTLNGHSRWDTVITKTTESKLMGTHFTKIEDSEKNVRATLIIDVGARNKKSFNAAIVLSDLDGSLESTYSLKASCKKQ